jgi:3',5'-cyclic AMP phosphodiesterase CpdA
VKKRVLILLAALLTMAFAGTIRASQTALVVKGTVYWDKNADGKYDRGEPGIANVCVSNGREVVATDRYGRYQLSAYGEMTVFVTKPADFDYPLNQNNIPQFSYVHQPHGSPAALQQYPGIQPTGDLPEAVNFPLLKANPAPNFTAVITGDMQVYNDLEIGYLRDTLVKEISGGDAAFVLALGDNVGDDLSLYPRLLKVMRGCNRPVYLVPGNHDMNYDSPDDAHSLDTFKREFGPSYYSFNYGKVHFVVLDTINYPSSIFSSGSKKTYHGEIDATQMEWLRNDLAYVPFDHLIVLNMHIPLVSFSDRASNQHQVQNRSRLYSLLTGRKVLALAGHTHTTENFLPGELEEGWGQPLPLHEMILGAACGSWWTGDFDEAGIPQSYEKCGAPRGYFNFAFSGNQYNPQFKATGKSGGRQMNLSLMTKSFRVWSGKLEAWTDESAASHNAAPPVSLNDLPDQGIVKASELGETALIANVWNGRSDQQVWCRFDRGEAVKAVRTRDVGDPYAMRQQLCVLRYAIGMKIYNSQYGPADPQPLSGLLATASTHLWSCPLPSGLQPGVHSVRVTVFSAAGVKQYEDSKVFEVTE